MFLVGVGGNDTVSATVAMSTGDAVSTVAAFMACNSINRRRMAAALVAVVLHLNALPYVEAFYSIANKMIISC